MARAPSELDELFIALASQVGRQASVTWASVSSTLETIDKQLQLGSRKLTESCGPASRHILLITLLAVIYKQDAPLKVTETALRLLCLAVGSLRPLPIDLMSRCLSAVHLLLVRFYEPSQFSTSAAFALPTLASQEETKVALLRLIESVFASSSLTTTQWQSADLRSHFCGIVYFLTEAMGKEERSKLLSQHVLLALVAAIDLCVSNPDIIIIFLPGLFSKLTRLLSSGEKRGGKVLVAGWQCLSRLLVVGCSDEVNAKLLVAEESESVLAKLHRLRFTATGHPSQAPVDDQPQSNEADASQVFAQKRDASWLSTVRRHIADGLASVFSVKAPAASEKVRLAQLETAQDLLHACAKTFPSSLLCILELILLRRRDVVSPTVAALAQSLFDSWASTSGLGISNARVASLLTITLVDRCRALPRFLRSAVDDTVIHDELETLTAYVQLADPISEPTTDVFMQAVTAIFTPDTVLADQCLFLRALSVDAAHEFCVALGKLDLSSSLLSVCLSSLRTSRDVRYAISVLHGLRFLIRGSEWSASLAQSVVECLFDNGLWTKYSLRARNVAASQVGLTDEGSYIAFACAVLSVTMVVVEKSGKSFLGLCMRKSLFRVLGLISDPIMAIRDAATECLRCMSTHCGFKSDPMLLLSSHMAILVDTLARQIKHPVVYPNAPFVLEGILHAVLKTRSFSWMFSFLQDTLQSTLSTIAEYHDAEIMLPRARMLVIAVKVLHECYLEEVRLEETREGEADHVESEVEHRTETKSDAEGAEDATETSPRDTADRELPPPREFAMVTQILDHATLLLAMRGSVSLSIAALDLVQECCSTLKDYPRLLNPKLHLLWPAFVRNFSADMPIQVQRQCMILVAYLVKENGSFLSARFKKDIMPLIVAVLDGMRKDLSSFGPQPKLTRRDILVVGRSSNDAAGNGPLAKSRSSFAAEQADVERVLTETIELLLAAYDHPQLSQFLRADVFTLAAKLMKHIKRADVQKLLQEMAHVDADSVWLSCLEAASPKVLQPPSEALLCGCKPISTRGSSAEAAALIDWMQSQGL